MILSREIIGNQNATLTCVGLLILTIVLYLYFLNMSVAQVVMRTEYVKEQQKLNNEIAMLEAVYIESQHVVASRISTLDGYDTDTDKIFVSRKQTPSFVLGQ
jgi:hypothetical protein